jgi:ribonuclease P protein component
MNISRLKIRSDFLKTAKAAYQARTGLIVQARLRLDDEAPHGHIRIGFTATKKIGGAVERNRAKRRLREVARHMVPLYGIDGYDYVFVARAATLTREWQGLLDDAKSALLRLSRPRAVPPGDNLH